MRKEKQKIQIRACRSDRILQVTILVFLTLALLVVAYPLYFVLISSISDPVAVATGKVQWYPVNPNLEGYRAVFKRSDVTRGFLNSVLYTVVGTTLNMLVTIPAGYALSRPDLKGKKWIIFFFMLTMFVYGGMMPTYLVVKGLHLIDTIWALVLPNALSVYNLIVAMSFFKSTLSTELLEAARVDGCSNTRFFINVAVPLSGAIIAIMVLYYGVGHWNSYFNALIYTTSKEKFPLQLVLRSILVQNQGAVDKNVRNAAERQRQQKVAELMKYSLIVISSGPILILYPFIQKQFVKGVMIGSLKG